MQPPLPPPLPDDARMATVEGLAGQVAGTLRLAGALAQGGRRLDLAGLDQMVGRLCAQALDLPPAQGRRVRPRLIALLGELDALRVRLAPD
ncbi:MAG TPA: hypothetical protein VL154_14260 [Acetobacteraceae bacterium]|nr:hypothetical protein [Acetobacteraceae bacterium]